MGPFFAGEGETKVVKFVGGLVGRTGRDIIRLWVAMNNVLHAERFEGVGELGGDAAHERQRHALKLVVLD